MKRLKDKILSEGKYLGNGILKVDSFMNHQIDPQLMKEVGEEFARRFKDQNPTRILTAESSGIAPALSAALVLGVPLVFARKHQPVTMAQNPFKESAMSHTKGNMVELIVSPEYFLATDRTLKALVKLVQASGATLVGIGAVIEKAFEGGRNEVSNLGVPVESLAAIASFDGDKVVFRE